jgi:hypothetical protein
MLSLIVTQAAVAGVTHSSRLSRPAGPSLCAENVDRPRDEPLPVAPAHSPMRVVRIRAAVQPHPDLPISLHTPIFRSNCCYLI